MTSRKAHAVAPVTASLAAARKRLGLSQRAVAERAGVTQAAVSHVERGSSNPQLSTFIDLVRALELDVRLVPRQLTPAFDALLRSQEQNLRSQSSARPLYALGPDDET